MSGGPDLTPERTRILELVSYLAVNLVDHPEAVTVDLVETPDGDTYHLRVHADDLGQLIGKGGQTARALRTLLQAVGYRGDQRIGLEIAERNA
ncbi:MAG: KH domain-containing protein [Candidatus Krumholzibacteriia bacterium]